MPPAKLTHWRAKAQKSKYALHGPYDRSFNFKFGLHSDLSKEKKEK